MKTLIAILVLVSAACASAQVYDGRGNVTASGGVPVSGRPAVIYPRVEPPPAGPLPRNNPAPFYVTPMANNGIIRNSEGGYAVPLLGGGYAFYGPGWGQR